MHRELSTNVLTAMLIGLVLFHVALVISALFYRKVNPLYLLAGAFIILAPVSVAPELPGAFLAKWARVYVTIVMVVIGLFGYRMFRFGWASKMLIMFSVFYVFAAVWSDLPIMGLMYKGLYAVTAVAGIFLAYSARDRDELARGVRFIGILGGFAGVFVAGIVLQDPDAVMRYGRLSLWGLNPNRIGLTTAPLLILCAYLALYDPSKLWKGLGYVIGITLALILLYTGSRSAAGTAAIGCFVVALPLIKRPVQATFAAAVVVLCAWLAVECVQTKGSIRLFETVTGSHSTVQTLAESRSRIWREGYNLFRKSPMFGQGWVHTSGPERPSTLNLHNIYLQSLAETGMIGFVLLCAGLLFALFRGFRVFVSVHRYAVISSLAALPLGLLLALLAHGAAEASMLIGSTLNSLFLGFSVGLIDHLPSLATNENDHASGTLTYRLVPRLPRRGTAGPEVTT